MSVSFNLITGACGGLGRAFVSLLAKRGESLFLTGRSYERLSELKKDLFAEYPALPVEIFACDLANEGERARLFAYADRINATFHRLVYVAGADIQKAFEKYTEEKIILQTRVNFEGAVSLTRAVFERRAQGAQTEFLAVGSVSGLYPMPYFALYSATKKALWQFYAALRSEWKGKAKVTCVAPGAMPTREDVTENIKTQGLWGKLAAMPPEKAARKCLRAVKKNKRNYIPGFFNKLMRVFTAPLPLSWKMKFIQKRWQKTEKDAF